MSHIVEKAIKLAKKTDSPCIIVDSEQEEGFVVVSLEQYEALLEGAADLQPHHEELPVEAIESHKNSVEADTNWNSVGQVLNKKNRQFEPAKMADAKAVDSKTDTQPNTSEEEGTYYFEPIE